MKTISLEDNWAIIFYGDKPVDPCLAHVHVSGELSSRRCCCTTKICDTCGNTVSNNHVTIFNLVKEDL